MVKPTQDGQRDDSAQSRADLPDWPSRRGDSLPNPLVRATTVEVPESGLSEDAPQVALPEDNHRMETLLTGAAKKPPARSRGGREW
jgi:hypothetical protein